MINRNNISVLKLLLIAFMSGAYFGDSGQMHCYFYTCWEVDNQWQ